MGYNKAEKARKVIDELSDAQRSEISPYVDRIIEIQKHISRIQDVHNADNICAACEGGCCIATLENRFDEVDYFVMFFKATESFRNKIIEKLIEWGNYPYCGFLTNEGCMIPENTRPPVCKSYFCDEDPELKEIMKGSMRIGLYEEYHRLSKILKEMGFDVGCNHISYV